MEILILIDWRDLSCEIESNDLKFIVFSGNTHSLYSSEFDSIFYSLLNLGVLSSGDKTLGKDKQGKRDKPLKSLW